jgi:hypothetical protein
MEVLSKYIGGQQQRIKIQEKRPNDVFVKRIKKGAKELGLRV